VHPPTKVFPEIGEIPAARRDRASRESGTRRSRTCNLVLPSTAPEHFVQPHQPVSRL